MFTVMNINKLFTGHKHKLLSGMLLVLCAGCTKNFENYNTNRHQATEEMMQYDNLKVGSFFVQMQKNVFPIAQQPEFGDEVYQTMQNLAGDVWSGYMGASNNWYSGSNNTTYDLIPQWYGQAFNRGFVGVMAAWKDIKASSDQAKTPQVAALATIIKVEAMHRITDMYGPLPYLNFGSPDAGKKYDSQQAIYNSFFNELNKAIDTLTTFVSQNPGATTLAKYDFVYGGNVTNWIKFANSLKLRLAMRIVYADAPKAKLEAESAIAHPIGVMTVAGEAAALQHSANLVYNHPLFIISENFGDIRMGAMMESFLTGYSDPRISSYFLPNNGLYRGILNGIAITNKATYSEGPFSKLNIAATTPVTWMNPAEVYFLRAEGAMRNWNMGGDAKSLYETGIRTSFTLTGAPSVDAYINNSINKPVAYVDPQNSGNNIAAIDTITIRWNDAQTDEVKLNRIIAQKWIAMYPDGQEAWSEFRRTGFPKIFPVKLNNSKGAISSTVRRLPFPSAEYQTNAAGVATGVSLLGGPDNGGTKLWWDKK